MNIKHWFERGFYDRYRQGYVHPQGAEGFARKHHRFGPRASLNQIREYRRGWAKAEDLLHRSHLAMSQRELHRYFSQNFKRK